MELKGFWNESTVNSMSEGSSNVALTGLVTLRVLDAWSYRQVSTVFKMVTPRQFGVRLVIMCKGVGDLGFQKGNLTQIYWSVSILFKFLKRTVRSKDLAPITKELGEIEAMFIFSGSKLIITVSVK